MSERVGIVGSRDWPRLEQVRAYVDALPQGTVIVSGGGGIVDLTAARAAVARGYSLRVYSADWQHYGRRAGPLRNTQIVYDCDRLVAFWDGVSRGTADTIRKARAAGIPVEVITL